MRWGKHCSVYPSGSRYMYDLRANLDGSVPVFRQALTPNYGFLDGVYAVPGRDGRQPEEIMVMRDGRPHVHYPEPPPVWVQRFLRFRTGVSHG